MRYPARERLSDGSVSAAEQQKLVDARFRASAVHWKEIYEREGVYEAIHQQRQAVALGLVDRLGLPPESHILEVGCGAGRTTVALAQRRYRVEAVDSVSAMIDLTRQLTVRAGVAHRVRTSVGDVQQLAFLDNRFRAVLALGVMPYLDSLHKPLQEMARVLHPGGYLIVNVDNRWRLNHVLDPRCFPALASTRWKIRDLLVWFSLRKSAPPKPRLHMHSLQEFDGLVSSAGLEKLEGMTLGFGPFSFFGYHLLPDSLGVRVHRKLQGLADSGFPILRSTGTQYIVLARKLGAN